MFGRQSMRLRLLPRHTIPIFRSRALKTSCLQYKSTTQVFEDNATRWWNGKEFELLRAMNEIRVPFIKRGLIEKHQDFREIDHNQHPLTGYKIVDAGCGGGILSEPLARLGASVTGIDPVHESILQAQMHAEADKQVHHNIDYRNCGIEDLVADSNNLESYDAVVASEVLEHILDVEGFLANCTRLIKPNGSLFITTINQTPLAYLGVILFGEYILRQLPKGTHTYDMFVNLTGLKVLLERLGYHLRLVNGFMYEPITGQFVWTPITLTHYAIHAIKTLPSHKSISHEQRRHFSLSGSSLSNKKRKGGPKVKLSDDEMMSVVPVDEFRARVESSLAELRRIFEKNLTTRTATISIDDLEINLEGTDEPLKLSEIGRISRKGSNTIMIDLSAMPQAVKTVANALTTKCNLNPQIEVNNICVTLPRVTRELRENFAAIAKKSANSTKVELRDIFSNYASKAKRSQDNGTSSDLVHQTIGCLQAEIQSKFDIVDNMLKSKTQELLGD